MASAGFDAFSGSEGYTSNYSNLFRIDVIDNPTTIEDVNVVEENIIYDLTGRRIKEIVSAGIYILNGKKVFIRNR